MASAELHARQTDVEQARARLSDTLDKLTSTTGTDNLKQELIGQVHTYKDQLLNQARDKSRDTVQQVTDDLKRRVAANPTGAALIGAGILWRLYKHPPITTLLIGAGAALLMRSGGGSVRGPNRYHDPYDGADPATYVPGGVAGYGYPVEGSAPGPTVGERVGAVSSDLGDKVQEVGAKAREAVSDAGARVSAVAERARSQAVEVADRARSQAVQAADRVRSQVSDVADRTGSALSQAVDRTRSEVNRVGAAAADFAERTSTELTGMARHTVRRAGDAVEHAQESPVVLGTLGFAAGVVIARALSNSETVHWAYDATGDALERGSRYAGSRLSDVAHQAGDLASSTTRHVAAQTARRRVSETFASDDEDQGMSRPPRGGPRPQPATSAYDRISGAYDSAVDDAYEAGRHAIGLGRRAQDEFSELADRYPLLLGVVALAAGAVVGGLLRTSDAERRLIGPVSDDFKQRARRLAQDHIRGVVDAAEHLGQEFQGKVADAADHVSSQAQPGSSQARPGSSQAQSGAKFADADLGTVVGGRSTEKAESIGPSGQPSAGKAGTGP